MKGLPPNCNLKFWKVGIFQTLSAQWENPPIKKSSYPEIKTFWCGVEKKSILKHKNSKLKETRGSV